MKNKALLIVIILLVLAGGGVGAYFLFRKKDGDTATPVAVPAPAEEEEEEEETTTTSAFSSQDSGVPPRIATIRTMEKYVDKLFVSDNDINKVYPRWNKTVKDINAVAKKWCKDMYDWCAADTTWSFATQREKAAANGYPLELQMVQSIAWELYSSQNLYPKAVWDKLSTKIFNLA